MNNSPTEFGKYCKKLRVDRDLNMETFAKKAGFTQPFISTLERGQVNPKFDTLIACMRAYDLKWPDTVEFLTKAITSFKNLHIPIGNCILPEQMFAKLIATIVAADGESTRQHYQWNAVSKVIETIKNYLDSNKLDYEINGFRWPSLLQRSGIDTEKSR